MSGSTAPHFWANFAYSELPFALWPARDTDAYGGSFAVDRRPRHPLVIGTTFDPATPYSEAVRTVRELGNARLLTMDGDGHTAYGRNSACIDSATETLPDRRDSARRGHRLPAAGSLRRPRAGCGPDRDEQRHGDAPGRSGRRGARPELRPPGQPVVSAADRTVLRAYDVPPELLPQRSSRVAVGPELPT